MLTLAVECQMQMGILNTIHHPTYRHLPSNCHQKSPEFEDLTAVEVNKMYFLHHEELVSEQSCSLNNLYSLLSSRRTLLYQSGRNSNQLHAWLHALQVCATPLEQHLVLTLSFLLTTISSGKTSIQSTYYGAQYVLITILASKFALIAFFFFCGSCF